MKMLLQKLINTFIVKLLCSFAAVSLISFQTMAGAWSIEERLSGMDSVYIYLPTNTPTPNNKLALMISLHGCGMSNKDMKNNADWSDSADQFGMVVALPDVPERGAFSLDCWDYYGENHKRNNKYNEKIINLALELTRRTELNIDSNQVYITGFSSGGGQANVIACLAPDIFAGVGSSAGPGLGSTAAQYSKVPSTYSVTKQASFCKQLAGQYAIHLNTQIYSTIHGDADKTVDPEFNKSAASIMASVYNSQNESLPVHIATDGTKIIYSDSKGPRVSKITVSEMGHKWSTGNGGEKAYFINDKVDYPFYVTQWLFANNRRVSAAHN